MIDYEQTSMASGLIGDSNDCAVHALAIVTQTSYNIVWELMDSMGRKPHETSKWEWMWNVLTRLDYTIVRTNPVYPARSWLHQCTEPRQPNGSRYTMKTIQKALDPSKRYLVYSRGHIAAVVNGKVEDWSADRKKIAKQVWEIAPMIRETESNKECEL